MLTHLQQPTLPKSNDYIPLAEFRSHFNQLFMSMSSNFSKLERAQSYQEPGNESLAAYLKGDKREAANLLKLPIEGWDERFNYVAQANIPWTRVRLVEFPMTPYLEWEFLTYQRSARYGERILVTDITNDPKGSLAKSSSDFVMFDNRIVLAHDYGVDGILKGAWLVTRPNDVEAYIATFNDVRVRAIPLGVFEASQKLPLL